jgi:uncharacterized protein YggE
MSRKSLAIVLAFIASAAAAFTQAAEAARVITVTGEALIMVVPDEAVVSLGVETFNASLQKGQELNTAAGKRVLAAVKALGVEDAFIKTQDLSVEIQYVSNDHPSRGIEGYTLRRMYVVTLKDVRRAAAVVNAALMSGANIVSGIDYRTTELRKHRDAARVAAVRAAREKATALTAELGCKIGKPWTVSEANLGYYGWGRERMTQNAMISVEGNETSEDLDVGSIPAGQIGIRATVQVVFDIVTGE